MSADALREKFDRLEMQMTAGFNSAQGVRCEQDKVQMVSAQVAWEEVYTKLIMNKQKGIRWSSPVIGQAVKHVGYMTLMQNGAACMAQFIREYNEVTRSGYA